MGKSYKDRLKMQFDAANDSDNKGTMMRGVQTHKTPKNYHRKSEKRDFNKSVREQY